MAIDIKRLSPSHPIVQAALAMVEAHRRHETMTPAIDEVREEFPDLGYDQAKLLWIGVNAKDREG